MRNSRLLVTATLLALSGAALASCGTPETSKPKSFDVTFYDDTTVLKTVQVEENATVEKWTPVKTGYTFKDWYATPSLSHVFDFARPITADTSIFAAFIAEEIPDTRDFYIVGSGLTPLLVESNWGKVVNDNHKLAKTVDKNEYTITLDLYKDDAFQFAINSSWHNQRGFGYLQNPSVDGKEYFKTSGGAYGQSTKRQNIIVAEPGNYTFTLSTHPADDQVEEGAPAGQEDGYNVNPFDTITWTRNGDAAPLEAKTTYYIKGSGITKWANINSPYHRMVENTETKEHKLSIFLRKGEQFMFRSTSTVGDNVSEGAKIIKSDAIVDEASKAFVTVPEKPGNIVAKEDGTYAFTYKEGATPTLKVEFDATKGLVPTDYYIDGTFGATEWKDYCFNPAYKLARKGNSDVFEIKNVELKVNSQIIIQAFKEGSTERGEWGTPGYNGLGNYHFDYLAGAGENFVPVDKNNRNIKVLTPGTYTVLFDEYTKTMNIVDGYDVYIKGSVNKWVHDFKADYKLAQDAADKKVYTISLPFAEGDEFGLEKFIKGTKTAGEWVGKANIGTTGDANAIFNGAGHNLKCTVAGTYKVSLNVETSLIDIFAVAA